MGGGTENSIRFVYDTVHIAKSEKNLQRLIDTVPQQCKHFEMQITVQKTEVMAFSMEKQLP